MMAEFYIGAIVGAIIALVSYMVGYITCWSIHEREKQECDEGLEELYQFIVELRKELGEE